jgi:dimethylargininase
MLVALTRDVSPAIAACQLTHLPRRPIDVEKARAQHAHYEQCLREAGCRVERVPAGPDMPDAVFIEDVALAFDEIAIATRPGAPSRRVEVPEVAAALGRYRAVAHIEPPGTLDGGDVLVVGRRVFVGRSSRSNDEAIDQLERLLAPYQYTVERVDVRGCLHLKSAVTEVGDRLLLVNPEWLPVPPFEAFERVEIDPREPYAANALRVGSAVVYPASFPHTRDRLARRNVHTRVVDVGELQKAEGAVTCCSLLLTASTNS